MGDAKQENELGTAMHIHRGHKQAGGPGSAGSLCLPQQLVGMVDTVFSLGKLAPSEVLL